MGWGGGEGWGRVYFVVMRVCREEVLVGFFLRGKGRWFTVVGRAEIRRVDWVRKDWAVGR